MVGGGEADGLKRYAGAPGGDGGRGGPRILVCSVGQSWEVFELDGAIQPAEEKGKLIEEVLKRWQSWELVGEHLGPVAFEGGDERRVDEVGGRWHGDALGRALLLEGLTDQLGVEAEVVAAEQVDDVVEVSGPGALGIARIFSAKTSSKE